MIIRNHDGNAFGERDRHRHSKRRSQHPLRRPEVRGATLPHLRHQVRSSTVVRRHQLEPTRRLDVQRLVSEVILFAFYLELFLRVIWIMVSGCVSVCNYLLSYNEIRIVLAFIFKLIVY